jgi:adenylate kinase family enzyme
MFNLGRGQLGRRINVVGTTGSGKTTTARRLAERLEIPHVEMDALNWGPNWAPADRDTLRERVAQALVGEAWVVDGNYSSVRDIVWGRADTIVWLDFSLLVTMTQLTRRTVRRVATKEELWGGNRERWTNFCTRDSILWWGLTTYRRRRREYPMLLAQPEYAHLAVVHLRSPRKARKWLAGIITRTA